MRVPAALAVLLLSAACQGPAEMTDADQPQIEAEVEQAIAEQWVGFGDAVVNLNYEAWASFWTPDARVLQPGSDLNGSDLFDFARDFFASGAQIFTFDVQSFEIFVHGEVAYQIGQLDETFQMPGGDPVEEHDYIFARWKKQTDGVWRISRFVVGPRDAPPEG